MESAGTNTRDLFFNNWNVLEERLNGASTADVQCVWSPVYVNALILRDRSTLHNGTLDERLYVQQDGNHNITALVNTSGTVVERYVYDSYGGVTYLNGSWSSISSSAYAVNYLYQSERLDTATGLYHMDYREYSPTLGRWINIDPIRFKAGDSNLYRFVGNQPQNRTDPSGEAWSWVLTGLGTGIGAFSGFCYGVGHETCSVIDGNQWSWDYVGTTTLIGTTTGATTGAIAGCFALDPSALMTGTVISTGASVGGGCLVGGATDYIVNKPPRPVVPARPPVYDIFGKNIFNDHSK
jgi:RHS repeat-associated protein